VSSSKTSSNLLSGLVGYLYFLLYW